MRNISTDKLKRSAPSRVVNVSSIAHKWTGPLDLSNLNFEKYFDETKVYFNTKLELVVFTRELARRLDGTGLQITMPYLVLSILP